MKFMVVWKSPGHESDSCCVFTHIWAGNGHCVTLDLNMSLVYLFGNLQVFNIVDNEKDV